MRRTARQSKRERRRAPCGRIDRSSGLSAFRRGLRPSRLRGACHGRRARTTPFSNRTDPNLRRPPPRPGRRFTFLLCARAKPSARRSNRRRPSRRVRRSAPSKPAFDEEHFVLRDWRAKVSYSRIGVTADITSRSDHSSNSPTTVRAPRSTPRTDLPGVGRGSAPAWIRTTVAPLTSFASLPVSNPFGPTSTRTAGERHARRSLVG